MLKYSELFRIILKILISVCLLEWIYMFNYDRESITLIGYIQMQSICIHVFESVPFIIYLKVWILHDSVFQISHNIRGSQKQLSIIPNLKILGLLI